MEQSTVDVLLSTYNGEKFLIEQLDSLLKQTNQELRIIIRDDGSTDNTRKILENYCIKFPERINLTLGKNIGVTKSYNMLLEKSTAQYILFCDQDDKWLSEKVTTMVNEVQSIEREEEELLPTLIYSDMSCIDETGNDVSASFWDLHAINPNHNNLQRLLLQNVVTGTACCFNRNLLELAMPIPEDAYLHDWWFALNATCFGVIKPLNLKLVQYRLHSNNVVGASSLNLPRLLKSILSIKAVQSKIELVISNTNKQAEALLNKHSSKLTDAQSSLLINFCELRSRNWINRRLFMLKHKILFSSKTRNTALLLLWTGNPTKKTPT